MIRVYFGSLAEEDVAKFFQRFNNGEELALSRHLPYLGIRISSLRGGWKDVHRRQFRVEDLVDFSDITTSTNVGMLRRILEFIGDSIRSKSHLFSGVTSAHDTAED